MGYERSSIPAQNRCIVGVRGRASALLGSGGYRNDHRNARRAARLRRNAWRAVRLARRFLVVLAALLGCVVIGATPTPAHAQVAGPGLSCFVGWAGEDVADGVLDAQDDFVLVVKCTTSFPMRTDIANMIAGECDGVAFPAAFVTATGSSGFGNHSHSNWCSGATGGVTMTYGDLVHEGGTISGNHPSYPDNTFMVVLTHRYCAGGGCGSYDNVYRWQFTTSCSEARCSDREYSGSSHWWAGVVNEPCLTDDCGTFWDEWPEHYEGGEPFPDAPCTEYGVVWEPADFETIPVGGVQRVTITTSNPGEFDSVEFRYSWEWGYDPLNGWSESVAPAVWLPPTIVSQTSTVIVLESKPVGTARTNQEFSIRCDPDEPLMPFRYYRRAYGDLSTSDGPSRRACYYLRFTVDGPSAADFDTIRGGRVWVAEDARFDDTGGISDLAYGWRPYGGERVTIDEMNIAGDLLPWEESPAEALFSVDASSLDGGVNGTQFIRCTDDVGEMWIRAEYWSPQGPTGGGGSGDGEVEGNTGGVGGEATPAGGDTTPADDGDPDPDDGLGVGPGAIGTGPGDGGSCFDNHGIGGWGLINPGQWVIGGIKVFACYLRALVVPDPAVLQAKWEQLSNTFQTTIPFGWFWEGSVLVVNLATDLPDAIDAYAEACWVFPEDGGLEVVPGRSYDTSFADICPYEWVAGKAYWDDVRLYMGRTVWLLWAIGVMWSAAKLWNASGTETFYVNASNPGAVWS